MIIKNHTSGSNSIRNSIYNLGNKTINCTKVNNGYTTFDLIIVLKEVRI